MPTPTILAHGNVADALAAVAASQPGAPLLHLPRQPASSYADLAEQIGHVRERLGRSGIACGDIVAGCVESRPHMALACAALPASSTFAPLASTLTAQAYGALLERLHPKAVLVPVARDHPLRLAAKRQGIPELRLTPDPAAAFGRFRLDLSPMATPVRAASRRRPESAYVLVTSGTTGRPKLVPLGHRQMLQLATTMIDWLRFDSDDVGCTVSPFHLAGGLRATLLIPWLSGGSVVCLPEGDSESLFSAIDEFAPTYISAGFAVHRALLRRASELPGQVARSRLRFLRPTTGRLEPDEIDRLEQAFGTPVVVGYGSTEACGIAQDPLPPRPRKRGAVGLPMAGEVAIIDHAGQVCPRGSTGEIVVRGPLVFASQRDDQSRRRKDRALRDRQRARVAPRRRGGGHLRRAAPDARRGAGRSRRPRRERRGRRGRSHRQSPVANGPASPAAPDLFRRPPAAHRIGKLRRAGLPALVGLAPGKSLSDDRIAPRRALSPLEATLAELWSDALRACSAGPDDDFFLLGGDSLSGMQLLAQVNKVFGVALPIRMLFDDAATIAGMARAIERQREGEPCASRGP